MFWFGGLGVSPFVHLIFRRKTFHKQEPALTPWARVAASKHHPFKRLAPPLQLLIGAGLQIPPPFATSNARTEKLHVRPRSSRFEPVRREIQGLCFPLSFFTGDAQCSRTVTVRAQWEPNAMLIYFLPYSSCFDCKTTHQQSGRGQLLFNQFLWRFWWHVFGCA